MSEKEMSYESLSDFLDEVSEGRVALNRKNKALLERLVSEATPEEKAKEKQYLRKLRPFFSVEEVASMQGDPAFELLKPCLDQIEMEEVDDSAALGSSLPEGVAEDAHHSKSSWQNHVSFWEKAGEAAYEADQQSIARSVNQATVDNTCSDSGWFCKPNEKANNVVEIDQNLGCF